MDGHGGKRTPSWPLISKCFPRIPAARPRRSFTADLAGYRVDSIGALEYYSILTK